MYDYTQKDIVNALKKCGLGSGDQIFCHSNIGFSGRLKGAQKGLDYYGKIKEAFFEVIGEKGTLVFPAFSYSFCKQKDFDYFNTPSVCGVLSEMARNDIESIRSEDANFSVAALGAKAKELTQDVSEYSFGENSFWDRFMKANGIFLNINFDAGSTFVHYAERSLKVPYRFDKGFTGNFMRGDKKEPRTYYHFCYDLEKTENMTNFVKFSNKAKQFGLIKSAYLGKGSLLSITAKDTFSLIEEQFKIDPFFLRVGFKGEK